MSTPSALSLSRALERLSADGVLIHMTLGKLKEGDIPGDIRDAAIRKMVEIYFPNNTAIISGFGFDMLYAGPREASLGPAYSISNPNPEIIAVLLGK